MVLPVSGVMPSTVRMISNCIFVEMSRAETSYRGDSSSGMEQSKLCLQGFAGKGDTDNFKDIATYLVGDYRRPEHLEEILTSVELGTKLHAFQMVGNHLRKMSLLGVFKRRKLISVMLTSNTNTQMVGDHLCKITL